MKNIVCENCFYARKVVSEDGRKEFVGCVKCDCAHKSEEEIIKFLNEIRYTGEKIGTGWCYMMYPDNEQVEECAMSSAFLLVEKNAHCKLFRERN
jgi:hypothetical protein